MRALPQLVQTQTLPLAGTPVPYALSDPLAAFRGQVILAFMLVLAGSITNAGTAVTLTERQVFNLLANIAYDAPRTYPGAASSASGYHVNCVAQLLGFGPESVTRTVPATSALAFRQSWIIPLAVPLALDSRGVKDTGLAAGDCPPAVRISLAPNATLAAIDADLSWTAAPELSLYALLSHPKDGIHIGQPLIIQETAVSTQNINETPNGVVRLAFADFDSAQNVTTGNVSSLRVAGAERSTGMPFDLLRRSLLETLGPTTLPEEMVPTFVQGETSRLVPFAWCDLGQRVSDIPTGPVRYQLGAAAAHTLVAAYTPTLAAQGTEASEAAKRGVDIARKENAPSPVQVEPVLEGPYDGNSSIVHKVAFRGLDSNAVAAREGKDAAFQAQVAAGASKAS